MRSIRHRHSRKWDRQRGAALVELAVVLPLLLFLSLMVMEGGAMIREHIIVNNAAREGARFSSLRENKDKVAGIKQVVTDYAELNGVNIPAEEITVSQTETIPGPDGVLMWASRVTVQHPYTMNYVPNLSLAQGEIEPVTVLYGRAEFRNFYGF